MLAPGELIGSEIVRRRAGDDDDDNALENVAGSGSLLKPRMRWSPEDVVAAEDGGRSVALLEEGSWREDQDEGDCLLVEPHLLEGSMEEDEKSGGAAVVMVDWWLLGLRAAVELRWSSARRLIAVASIAVVSWGWENSWGEPES